MDDISRIYSLLLHSNGLKIRAISSELELDKYYVAEIMFSSQNINYWYQDDDSLWFAKEGALQVEEPKLEKDELITTVVKTKKYNINRFLQDNTSKSLRAYLVQISQFQTFSNDDIFKLFERYRAGDRKAYELLVKSQQRLIANIALQYSQRGVPLEDLIQEGNIGLIRAIELFDPSHFRSFSNYAYTWIFQAISNSLCNIPYLVRLPINLITLYRRVHRFIKRYEQSNEYLPSIYDIDIAEDCDLERLIYIYQLPENLREQILYYDNLDIIESETDLFEIKEDEDYNKFLVQKLLSHLNRREKNIIKFYYGIDTAKEDYSSIAEKMKLTRERVRQIIWTSIRYLQDITAVKRIEAKKGDYIQIDSQQLGQVIKTKKNIDGSTILELKMKNGLIKKISTDDTPYRIVRKRYQKNAPLLLTSIGTLKKTDKLSTQKAEEKETHSPIRKEIELDDLKVGDMIIYDNQCCTVQLIYVSSISTKLIVKYSNGVLNDVPYDTSRFVKTSHFLKSNESNPQNEKKQETSRSHKIAMIGDIIQYESKKCKVLEKMRMNGSFRLIVKYEDGCIDNVLDDRGRYKIL